MKIEPLNKNGFTPEVAIHRILERKPKGVMIAWIEEDNGHRQAGISWAELDRGDLSWLLTELQASVLKSMYEREE